MENAAPDEEFGPSIGGYAGYRLWALPLSEGDSLTKTKIVLPLIQVIPWAESSRGQRWLKPGGVIWPRDFGRAGHRYGLNLPGLRRTIWDN